MRITEACGPQGRGEGDSTRNILLSVPRSSDILIIEAFKLAEFSFAQKSKNVSFSQLVRHSLDTFGSLAVDTLQSDTPDTLRYIYLRRVGSRIQINRIDNTHSINQTIQCYLQASHSHRREFQLN